MRNDVGNIRGYLPFNLTVMLSWVINPITNYLTIVAS
jgi:hypothetical protein